MSMYGLTEFQFRISQLTSSFSYFIITDLKPKRGPQLDMRMMEEEKNKQ